MAIRFGSATVASPNKEPASPNAPSPNKSGSRNAKWRAAHQEQYRAYMRELMRKRRAATKSTKSTKSAK